MDPYCSCYTHKKWHPLLCDEITGQLWRWLLSQPSSENVDAQWRWKVQLQHLSFSLELFLSSPQQLAQLLSGFRTAGNGEGIEGNRGRTCWQQALLTHSNAACRSALSDMGYSLISKPAHQIPTRLSHISLKKPIINCHYYVYSHNPQPGPPRFTP